MNWKLELKNQIQKLSGKYNHLKINHKCNTQWYGSTYGGFFVHPDVLNNHSVVYSFGIGEDISFDKDVIRHHDCSIFAFDPTPKSIQWVNNNPALKNFHFYEYGIGSKDAFVDFFLPVNEEFVSGSMVAQTCVDKNKKVSVEMKSLSTIAEKLGHKTIDILKIDIEGSEYDIIDSILDSNIKINQLLIEVHDRLFEDGLHKTKSLIQKLNNRGFEIFGVSKTFEEISLIHKSLI